MRHLAAKPMWSSEKDFAPPEVRDFLGRVLEKLPDSGVGVTDYRFFHWERNGKPTQEAVGVKAVPVFESQELIDRIMNVDGYASHIAHVVTCHSEQDPDFTPPHKVRFFQVIQIPGVTKVQQVLVLVDAGMIKGYRVAYWYLLKEKTAELNPKAGARNDFNVGAWLAAPGVVGYAISCWPRREDVNRLQWITLTSGANAMAKRMVEGNIDGMVDWARKTVNTGPRPNLPR